MDWKSLDKQQQQLIFLAVFLTGGALFGVWQFVVKPVQQTWAESVADLVELESKLKDARTAVRGEQQVRESLANTSGELQEAAQQYIPPPDNPLAWATAKMYGYGRDLNIDIDQVSEMTEPSTLRAIPGKEDILFGSYKVRIVAQGSFRKTVELISAIEKGESVCGGCWHRHSWTTQQRRNSRFKHHRRMANLAQRIRTDMIRTMEAHEKLPKRMSSNG